uniref:7TM GPCR domain containing protein n=1 Tax=Haemonchus contortus TaxID=6289 RepID=W6NDM4_HAECO
MLVHNGSFVFLTTGRGSEWSVAPTLILVYNATLISTLVYSTNSFIYRFIQLCRPHLFFIYTSFKCLAVYTVINVALITNWVLMVYFTGWPKPPFTAHVKQLLMTDYDFNLGNRAFVGFSLDMLPKDEFVMLMEALSLPLVLVCIAFSCALRVYFYLKSNALSSQTKRMQKTLFVVLLIQTACPASSVWNNNVHYNGWKTFRFIKVLIKAKVSPIEVITPYSLPTSTTNGSTDNASIEDQEILVLFFTK